MQTISSAIRLLTKRPSILILTLIVSIVLCLVENLLMTFIYGLSMFKTSSPFDAFINIIQFLIDTILVPTTAVKIILALVVLVVVGALVLGFLLSGYFNILRNAVEGRPKKLGSEFFTGLKKYFMRMVSINLWVLCLGIIFIVYVTIASVPAAIFIDNSFNGTVNVFAGILLFLVTAVVLFFSFAFFRQYVVFWYPAALTFTKNHFKIAKKISDNNFWSLLPKFIVFDVLLVLFNSIYIAANFTMANSRIVSTSTSNLLLIVDIVFKTIFIAIMVCFVFSSFKKYSDKLIAKKLSN